MNSSTPGETCVWLKPAVELLPLSLGNFPMGPVDFRAAPADEFYWNDQRSRRCSLGFTRLFCK